MKFDEPAGNPYWEALLQCDGMNDPNCYDPHWYTELPNGRDDPGRSRNVLTQQYSWAITAPSTITWLAQHAPPTGIVEIGAGRGYWASLLAAEGVDVICYDKAPPVNDKINEFHATSGLFHPVFKGGPRKAALHSDRMLFLCWPPYLEDMAEDTLRAYQGNLLAHCGEGYNGCTGDDGFRDLLCERWEEVDECEEFVSWRGLSDRLVIYRRIT